VDASAGRRSLPVTSVYIPQYTLCLRKKLAVELFTITLSTVTVKPLFLAALNFGGSGYLIILAPVILAFLLAELILGTSKLKYSSILVQVICNICWHCHTQDKTCWNTNTKHNASTHKAYTSIHQLVAQYVKEKEKNDSLNKLIL